MYLRPGETKTVTARCPKGQSLVSGGFQRTDFRSDGGDYVTESHAVGTKAWVVSGHAYGVGSGELTSIAYCARMKRPIITEVASSPAPVAAGRLRDHDHANLPGGQAAGHRRVQHRTAPPTPSSTAAAFNPDGTFTANAQASSARRRS